MVSITNSGIEISGTIKIKSDNIDLCDNQISLKDGSSIVISGNACIENNTFDSGLHCDFNEGELTITKLLGDPIH